MCTHIWRCRTRIFKYERTGLISECFCIASYSLVYLKKRACLSVPPRVRDNHLTACWNVIWRPFAMYIEAFIIASERKAVWKSSPQGEKARSQGVRKPVSGITHLTKTLLLSILLEGNTSAIFGNLPVLLSSYHASTFGQFKINFPLGIYRPREYSGLKYNFFQCLPRWMRIFQKLFSTSLFCYWLY